MTTCAHALLKSVMHGQSFLIAPKPIKGGRDNEPAVCNAYVEYLKKTWPSWLVGGKVRICGTSRIWPAWRITRWQSDCPSSRHIHGIVKFKCPYSKWKMLPQELCGDSDLLLPHIRWQAPTEKRTSLLPSSTATVTCMSSSSSVVWLLYIYTKGILVERILPDTLRWDDNVPRLEDYFDRHMLPAIACPHYKPGRIL